jgi:cell division protein FtsL
MYKIFYIDIDEEITSVIDRLKKSKTTENFFVVSPRSLILQSVVSLKLLKREAAKQKKQIAIVVNDKEASTKIEKAGILVLSSLKGLEGEEEVKESFSSKMEIKDTDNKKHKNVIEKIGKKGRLQKIGTEDFFGGEDEKPELIPEAFVPESENLPPSISSKPVAARKEMRQRNTSDVKRENSSFSYIPERNLKEFSPHTKAPKDQRLNRISDMKNMDPYKERLVEGFFNPETKVPAFNKIDNQPKKKIEKNIPVSRRMKKIIFSFFVVCLSITFLVVAYLFLPGATVAVTVKNEIKKVDLSVKGDVNQSSVSLKDLAIPARILEKEDSISDSFKTTGKKTSSSDTSKKAKGTITIYNEYNNEPQQLIATTRFISTDGKLFRLVKSATVPGMTGNNPGSVEASVIADQPGEEYNIDPADFKIPGFEGSPKYDKFYAKSASAMTGGGSGGANDITIVSQSDLDAAKKDTEAKMKDQLESDIKAEMGAGYVFIPEASEETISNSSPSVRLNEVANDFNYSVSGKIKAFVFSENDVKKIAGDSYNETNKEKTIKDYSLIKINYGASSADFNSGTISLKINAEIPVDYNTDWNEFKKNILGKNDDQIKEVLKSYPQIEKLNIEFWPKFMSQKIPQYEKRVIIDIKNSSD